MVHFHNVSMVIKNEGCKDYALLVSLHIMRGRELSTLVVILSSLLCVTLECHFEVVRKQERAFYSHRSFSTAGKSLLLLPSCI